jgi:hypothetical protein
MRHRLIAKPIPIAGKTATYRKPVQPLHEKQGPACGALFHITNGNTA